MHCNREKGAGDILHEFMGHNFCSVLNRFQKSKNGLFNRGVSTQVITDILLFVLLISAVSPCQSVSGTSQPLGLSMFAVNNDNSQKMKV